LAAVSDKIKETEAPRLARRHVRRPRLTLVLDEATSQVVLITGPAGYGKTTLAAEWLQGRTDAVWFRATPASADLAAFSAGLSDVLQQIAPGAGERLKQRLRVAEAPEKAARSLAELLAEDLDAWPKEGLVVVDDYHLVADSGPVEEFVDWLLLLAPIRFVVTARHRPKWASARRLLYGEITEVGRDQLAMTQEEAAQVLGARSTDSVRHLVAQAEGWPALIGLAGLCASAEVPEERVSEALFRYFAEEVFRREPPEVQQFMLIASVPPTINVGIVGETLGVAKTGRIVDSLAQQGLLHENTPNGHRFHPLLREFLRRKLQEERPGRFKVLVDIAIAEARGRSDWDTAFELAVQTNQLAVASQITGEASLDLFAAGRLQTVEKWLAQCGASVLDEPYAVLAQGETLLRRGRIAAGAALASSLANSLSPGHRLASRAWSLRGEAMHFLSDDTTSLEYYLTARNLARNPIDLARALWGAFLAATVLEVDNASAFLDQLETLAPAEIDSRLRLAAGRVIAGAHSGSYGGLTDIVEPLIGLSKHASDPLVRSSFLVRAADLRVARCDYKEAKTLASEAADLCRALHLDMWATFCIEIRAAAELGLREFRLARRSLDELARAATESEDPYLDLAVRNLTVKLALCESHTFTPSARFDHPSPGLQKSTLGEYLGLLAIAASARGAYSDAAEYVRKARELTRSVDARCYAAGAEVISLVSQRSSTPDVVTHVSAWFTQCTESGFLHGLVVGYRAFPELLQILAQIPGRPTAIESVLRKANDAGLSRRAGLSLGGVDQTFASLLTRRELEVLELLRQGMTNGEIAKRLYISLSTVKVHVHHILKKTGARTRLDAAMKGRAVL
jgi:DNA-binding CsgD family transcriptional regulator/tetratricopeptide (TPR) repeat protein